MSTTGSGNCPHCSIAITMSIEVIGSQSTAPRKASRRVIQIFVRIG